MTQPSRRALIIAHEPDGPGGQVERRLEERGYRCDTVLLTTDFDRPNDAAPVPSMDGYDLLVLMGSVRSLTNKDEISSWVHDELDLIRATHAAGTPMLGVCFGGQLISDALGGSVGSARHVEIGWYEIEAPDGVVNPVGPGPWFQWHHDCFDPPPGAELLATNASAPQLFRLGNVVGTQFHPEVDVAHVEGFLEMAPDDYLAEEGVSRDAMMVEMRENEERNIKQCYAFVDWFLDEVVASGADPRSS